MPRSWCISDTDGGTGENRKPHHMNMVRRRGEQMTELRRISYQWKDSEASKEYATGVSLHSHTNQSKETLDFIANLGSQYRMLRPLFREAERRSRERHNTPLHSSA